MGSLWRRILGYAEVAPPPRTPARKFAARPAAAPSAEETAAAHEAMSLAELRDRFHRYVLGLPDHVGDEPTQQERAILKRLQATCGQFDVRSLPRLPTVLPQLLRSLKSDTVGGAQLAKLIGRDPVLVGEVMRVSRSIYYRTLHPIQSLQHAVVLLGQDGLRRVVTMHVMKPILHASAGMFGHVAGQRLWDHAERCAHACAYLGKSSSDPFEAYLAGIVCNTGTGAVVRVLDQEAPAELGPLTNHFLASCAQMAAHISLRAAQHWNLPGKVLFALQERAEVPTEPESPLGRALMCANTLAMAQVLGEHALAAPDTDLSTAWPDVFTPAMIERCQQDLRRQFRDSDSRGN
ncbi:HDOD domain-containing protein [Dyella sp.]|jgi:HD-like signal output (HDOD) protein|uniref:HDOD domain-containing protein n=1 Tax=Dyella sp. TaxID=1869338 RepID=UPI002D79CB2E|nr:HDOD domain-containing protein [Dyella sp.]HET6431291.1 HDOD domain-containing protein [Dyella sp.]